MKDPSHCTSGLALPIALGLLFTLTIMPAISMAALPPAPPIQSASTLAGYHIADDTTFSPPLAPPALRRALPAITKTYHLEDPNGDNGGYAVSEPQSTWEWGLADSYDGVREIRQREPPPGVYLSPDALEVAGCNGSAENYTLNLTNWTGSSGPFSLTYSLAEPALGLLTGPTTISLSHSASTSFTVTLTPDLCLPAGLDLVGSVEASGNGYVDSTIISKTIITGGYWDSIADEPGDGRPDSVSAGYNGLLWSIGGQGDDGNVHTYQPSTNTWTTVPTSAPPFGANYARSGCQTQATVIVYGDATTPGFAGLWSYDVNSNSWHHLSPTGTPPPDDGIWAPAWVYDPEDNLCYLTGGARSSASQGFQELNTVYTYDPATNAWVSPSLPPFETARRSHAAWIVGSNDSGSDKLLCVAGGTGALDLDSTQCYDLATGAWNGENADLGVLPDAVTSMGYTERHLHGAEEQLWIIGGTEDGMISSHAIYYDGDRQEWRDGGYLTSGAAHRTSAATLDGEIYRIGGIAGDDLPSAAGDRHVQCPTCADIGWLAGYVQDYDGASVPCTNATVNLDPGNMDVPVSTSGTYTIATIPFAYQATARADGYPKPDGPHTVTVAAGTVTTRDFTLTRPAIGVIPTALTVEAIAPNTVTRYITIANGGPYTLQVAFQKIPPPVELNPAPASHTSVRAGIEVEPDLQLEMDGSGTAGYLIYFRDRPDLSAAFGMDWSERGWFVATALQETAKRSQARVRALLDDQAVDYEPFWIDNVIAVNSSSRNTLNSLIGFSEIAALRARRTMHLIQPQQSAPALEPSAVEPNISHIEADQVWGMGFRGDGLVVANIDTGVRYTHEALQPHYRGNLGGGSYDHDYNWFDPDTGSDIPYDDHGHGSHTMGIMVGSDGEANQIGVAPGAQWIACDACSVDGGCPDNALLACAQWIIAPYPIDNPSLRNPDLRPHVVNNSWGDCAQSYDPWFQSTVDAWHAAGIYPVFSNGNASNCEYPSPPGCMTVSNPARYGNVTGVGSTGRSNGLYAPHSCWGPTDNLDTMNPRDHPDLKPQVVAPGVSIRSSLPGSDYLYGNWGGTSMSAPHVAALVALMWQAAPCLVGAYATTETIIEQTATPITYTTACSGTSEGPDGIPSYATGWGEINARAAVKKAISFCNRDWLPWVKTDIVTGALATGAQAIETTFTCNPTAALQLQPLQGTLLIEHNDPCQEPAEVSLTFFCAGQTPSPLWRKEVWIGDSEQSPVEGPHTVRPGDTVTIVDWVGATYSGSISSVLTETWSNAVELVSYDTGGLVSGTARGPGTVVLPDANSLIWELVDVPPNIFHPITKTFQVQHGDWTTGLISEAFTVQDAITQRADVVVTFVPHEPAIKLDKRGPGVARKDQAVALALVITSDGKFFGNATLTDTLPAHMTYSDHLTATHGRAWQENNVIHWTSYTSTVPPVPPTDVVADGGFEDGTPNDHWSETSLNFGTPLCDERTCDPGSGTGPHSGDWWARFGGALLTETGSLDQDVTIPLGNAQLSFWLEIPEAGTRGLIEASIDGSVLFSATEAIAGLYVPYRQVTLDVSAYADGSSHNLRFESTTDAGAGKTSFFVDDVSLTVTDTDPMPGLISITFDTWITGTDEICNVAELNWGEDYTSDEHCVAIADHDLYLPIVLRDS
jgi:subtilisin family serine protease